MSFCASVHGCSDAGGWRSESTISRSTREREREREGSVLHSLKSEALVNSPDKNHFLFDVSSSDVILPHICGLMKFVAIKPCKLAVLKYRIKTKEIVNTQYGHNTFSLLLSKVAPHAVWPLKKQLVFGYVTFFLQLFLGKPELFSPAEWQHKTQHHPLKD